jgi:hypothetical protein
MTVLDKCHKNDMPALCERQARQKRNDVLPLQ